MKRLICAIIPLSVAVSAAFAYDVSNADRVQTKTETSFTVRTASADYPSDLGEPLFWLDASDTTDWTFSGATVTRVPSKTGPLSLTTEATGGAWYQWTNGTRPQPPAYVTDEAGLVPGCALDFGALGSNRGLVFADASGAATILTGMGTTFLVYGSQNGGGWLLGGGENGYYWHRAYDSVEGTYDGTIQWQRFVLWTNPLFQNVTGSGVKNAVVRHDGVPTVPSVTGFSHGWEVLSVQPTDGTVSATGLGLGDTRDTNYSRSGGMKVAEFIAFGKTLTAEEIVRVEAYLQKKWFGRPVRGTAGNASLGSLTLYGDNTAATLDVPAGETLQLDGLAGGHGTGASLAKTGEGALRLSNAERYGGTLKLKGGRLEWPGKAAPTKAELPHDLYLHFDASDLESLDCSESDGHMYVDKWTSQVEGHYYAQPLYAKAKENGRRPELLTDALGEGLSVLDFGTVGSAGRYLEIVCDKGDAAALQVGTVVALVGAQNGGGAQILSGGAFNRGNNGTAFYDALAASRSDGLEGSFYLDGAKTAAFNPVYRFTDNGHWYDFAFGGFRTPDWHVVSHQTFGQNAGLIGAKDASWAGGARYAEILIWNRTLSEAEVLSVHAYLAKKWLGKGVPGYETTAAKSAPDVETVRVEAAAELAVGGADETRLGSLDVSAPLVKSGTGTLTVGAVTSDPAAGSLDLAGGTLAVVGAADVSAKCELAANPAFHLDPSDTTNLRLKDGTKEVLTWLDGSGKNGAYAPYKASSDVGLGTPLGPLWDDVNTCNGLPVLNFGALNSMRWLTLCKPVESAKHLYAIANVYGGAWLFGSDAHSSEPSGTTYYDYHRSTAAAGSGIALQPQNWKSGTVCENGINRDGYWAPPDEIILLEFHPGRGTHVSALCHDRNIDSRAGGAIVGEVVVYDRELSEREKLATRNYLMKKWLGKSESELADLPASTAARPSLPTVKVAAASAVRTDVATKALRVTGKGALEKTGAGELEIDDLTMLTGTVAVAAGTVRLPYAATPAATFAAEGRILHVDATQGLETETGSDGTIRVVKMNSLVGDGVYAEAHAKDGMMRPQLISRATGRDPGFSDLAADRPAVLMQAGDAWEHYFLFKKGGELNELTGIRSVYWVIGSQFGGGFLLGGGQVNGVQHQYAWHRGTANGTGSGSGDGANQCMVGGAAPEVVRNADWMLNGTSITGFGAGSPGLSGGWDVLSVRIRDGYATAPTADGFAFDGRIFEGEQLGRCGRQWLAEVIIYNRRLTDEEDAQTRAYLSAKWGFAVEGTIENASFELAEGAALDCGGKVQHVGTISGAGSVVNGTVAVNGLVVDLADAGLPSFERLSIVDGLSIDVRNVPDVSEIGSEFKIADVANLDGIENLRTARITADVPEGTRLRARYHDGALYLKVLGGLVIQVR